MSRSLLPATVVVAVLALAANRPIPERVREAALQSLFSIAYCRDVPGAPEVANPFFADGKGPLQACDGTHGQFLLALQFAISVVAADKTVTGNLSWNNVDTALASMSAAETKLLGRPFVVEEASEANGWKVKRDPAALQAAFDAYYVKPTVTVGGLRAQQVYDVVLKERANRLAEALAVATHTPGLLAGLADALRSGKVSDARGMYYTVATDLSEGRAAPVNSDELGFVVRRELDGSLSLFRKLFAATLKDYDPAAAKRLDDKSAGVNDGKVFVRFDGSNDRLTALTVDGRFSSCDSGCPPMRLAVGKHVVTAEGESNSVGKATVEVGPRTTEVVIPMLRAGWNVPVESEPAGAQFTVDGVLRMRAPQKSYLAVGERALAVVDPCLEPVTVKVDVGQSEPAPMKLVTKPRTAVLKVEAVDFDGNPASADWTLDGTVKGTANADATVPLCSRKLVVKGPGGRELTELLVLDAAAPTVKRFTVTEPPRPSSSDRVFTATWTTLGRQALAGADRAAVSCPRRSGKVNPLWGDGTFTDDSSVCAAARFRGRIDDSGGRFFVRRAPGRDSYAAGSRNGIDSQAFGKWSASFEVE